MLKKILVGAAALGLTAAALANGDAIPAISAAPASEFNPGIYLGLQGGYGLSGWKRADGNDFKVTDDASLTGRVFAGYDFTKYWAMELGYAYFGSKTKIRTNDGSNTLMSEITTQAFDLVGKGKVPVVDNFDIYGKFGVGYLMSKGINKNADALIGQYMGEKDKQNNIAGVVGVGAEYYFMPNLWMDLSWTRYMTNAKFGTTKDSTNYVGKYQPDADFYALGIAYKFNM